MCGIAGCYQQADGRKLVEIMTDRIAHRGPDAAGIWEHDDDLVTAQLGHRRLSIIDLSSAADQPLSRPTGGAQDPDGAVPPRPGHGRGPNGRALPVCDRPRKR